MKKYLNMNLTIDERIEDLIGRMTIEDKVSQLALCEPRKLIEEGRFSREKALETLKHKNIGTITVPNLSPKGIIEFLRDLQAFVKEETDLGIPILMVAECLHGLMSAEATVFPQSIALASSFDEDLIEAIAVAIAKEASAIGARQGLAPDLDLAREPRWGRVEETYGEDPYLCERLGVAYIKGLQGETNEYGIGNNKIAATLKHYVAHGSPEGGLNLAPVAVGARQLRELYLPPFEAAVREAKALSVMNAYSEIDGIPCASSAFLLNDVLRGEWNFDGYIIADFESIAMLQYFQKTAPTYKEAGYQAFKAGLDLEAPVELCYGDNLIELVSEGRISETELNTSVARVLRVKFATGLFDGVEPDVSFLKEIYNCNEHRDLARRAAEESIVLLENRGGILPLGEDCNRIAVIGPNAENAQIGDYTMDKESLVSPLDGLKGMYGSKVSYAKGCDIVGSDESDMEAAVDLAKNSDVAILCVGGTSMVSCGIGWETESEFEGFAFKNKFATCGEGFDRADLDLPGSQSDLIKAVMATGTPTIVVLINGRPYGIPEIAEQADAMIEMWYSGEEGGNALASVLSGKVNPSGKLPISFPKHVGQLPVYYNHKPSAKGFYGKPGSLQEPGRDYVFSDPKPLYSFGYGLSYTRFEYNDLRIDQSSVQLMDGHFDGVVDVSVTLRNTGEVRGKEVVQLYVNDLVSSVSTPVKSLRAFKKVDLMPGESTVVEFKLNWNDFALYNQTMDKVVEPGEFEIMIGDQHKMIEMV